MLKKHSYESFIYSVRTAEFNYALAKEMGFSEEEAELYYECGLLHDIGKLGMSTFLINYPSKYTKEMFKEMKKHTIGGGDVLKRIKARQACIDTAKYHHCNFDGSGYLYNLKGKEIPFAARLTRVSDSADAYLSKRSYKDTSDGLHVYEDLIKYCGTWYDPEILKYFKKMHNKVVERSKGIELTQEVYMEKLNEIYETKKITKKWL